MRDIKIHNISNMKPLNYHVWAIAIYQANKECSVKIPSCAFTAVSERVQLTHLFINLSHSANSQQQQKQLPDRIYLQHSDSAQLTETDQPPFTPTHSWGNTHLYANRHGLANSRT